MTTATVESVEYDVTADDLFAAFGALTMRYATGVAKRVFNQHREFVSVEDVQQECLVWVVENPGKVYGWINDEGRNGLAKLGKALWRVGNKYAMEERYQKDGTRPEDYYKYSSDVVKELLPDAFDPEYDGGAGQSLTDYDMPRAKSDPSQGMNRLAAVVDVRHALSQIGEDSLMLLREKFEPPGLSYEALAVAYDTTTDAAYKRVERAVGRVAAKLGLHEFSDYTGRKVLSNAAAQSVMARQYG